MVHYQVTDFSKKLLSSKGLTILYKQCKFSIFSSENLRLFEGLWNLFDAIFSFLVYSENQS